MLIFVAIRKGINTTPDTSEDARHHTPLLNIDKTLDGQSWNKNTKTKKIRPKRLKIQWCSFF